MNKDQSPFSAMVTLVMMLATGALGWFAFSSSRPVVPVADNRTSAQVAQSQQNVVARLWEDPLSAVQAELSKPSDKRSSPTPLDRMKEYAEAKSAEGKTICLLVVPIPDTPFPDDTEARLRMRYSVQMALLAENYAPDNRDHLGYLKLPGTTDGADSPEGAADARKERAALFCNLMGFPVGFAFEWAIPAAPSDNGFYAPYEWFVPRNPSGKVAVLLLWLPEAQLRSKPLSALASLRHSLAPAGKIDLAGVFVIGPRSSDTLIKMADDNDLPAEVEKSPLFRKLCIFSPQATTPDPLIPLEAQQKWADARKDLAVKLHRTFEDPNTTELPKEGWRYFHNFIAPDDQLTDLLVHELHLRGVNRKLGSTDRILILAEADTSYGHSLPIAFEASLKNYKKDKKEFKELLSKEESKTPDMINEMIKLQGAISATGAATGAANVFAGAFIYALAEGQSIFAAVIFAHTAVFDANNPQLLVYRYLRGLDQQKGQQGNEKAPTRQVGKSPEELLAEVLSTKGAMPLGESQLDYVDRLANRIPKTFDDEFRELQKKKEKGEKGEKVEIAEIKAVGVLGTDLYDKLILLRSLRRKFPQAVFFTTDLDARMWHPDHLPFTRNLVVASAYGVDAGDESAIPPFRDGYQVAMFKACRAALTRAASPSASVAPLPSPSIFELGRNGPQKLQGPPKHERTVLQVLHAGWPNMQLPWPKTQDKRKGLRWMMVGMAVALTLWVASDRIRTGKWKRVGNLGDGKEDQGVRFFRLFNAKNRWVVFVIAISILSLWLCYGAMPVLAGQPDGEPWAWGQGISIWPTEMVRLLIILTVITSLTCAWRHHLISRRKVMKEFRLRRGPHKANARSKSSKLPLPRSANHANQSGDPPCKEAGKTAEAKTAAELFQDYVNKARWWCRALRVTLATLAYMAMAFGMMFFVEGHMLLRPNVRGEVAQVLDLSMLFASIFCFLWLLFYVLDAVLISGELLRKISNIKNTEWPETLLQKKRKEFWVHEEDLPGYLDVRFAAVKSQETGRLILLPFIIQFLFVVSRNSYFDNWPWPGTLIGIFVCNIVLAGIAWMLMRSSAKKLRKEAINAVKDSLDKVSREIRWATAKSGSVSDELIKPKDRRLGLLKLQKQIEEEHDGAYAKFFQDPALFAVLLPSGLLGILTVLIRALFGGI